MHEYIISFACYKSQQIDSKNLQELDTSALCSYGLYVLQIGEVGKLVYPLMMRQSCNLIVKFLPCSISVNRLQTVKDSKLTGFDDLDCIFPSCILQSFTSFLSFSAPHVSTLRCLAISRRLPRSMTAVQTICTMR